MARQTFVTPGFPFKGTKTVDILTRSDVKKIVVEVIGQEIGDNEKKQKEQERKLAKISEQVADASKYAAEAREEVNRIVEIARETFREVIEELLAPHYRLLAQHLGVEVSEVEPMGNGKLEKDTVAVLPQKKTTPSKNAPSLRKKATALKKKTGSSPIRKGAKPCRK